MNEHLLMHYPDLITAVMYYECARCGVSCEVPAEELRNSAAIIAQKIGTCCDEGKEAS